MKAIQLTAYGNPTQSLELVELPEPNRPSAGEALVRMEYAPIANSDLLLADGVYLLKPKLPSVIGGEGAGIVEVVKERQYLLRLQVKFAQQCPQWAGGFAPLPDNEQIPGGTGVSDWNHHRVRNVQVRNEDRLNRNRIFIR